MLKMMVQRCPVPGGRPRAVNEAEIRAMRGVHSVVTTKHAVAVLGETFWQTQAAIKALQIDWDVPEHIARHNTETLFEEMVTALNTENGKPFHSRGIIETALASAEHSFEADFRTPYLAHATMEPMTCAVHIDGDVCHIWDGTQSNTMTRDAAARTLGWPRQRIQLHPLFAGGGFGRRPYNDYVVEAVEVAATVKRPVHLIWTREHDMQHDYYRPASVVRLRAGVSSDGRIQGWRADRAGPNLLPYVMDEMIDFLSAGKLPLGVADWLSKRNYDVFAAFPIDIYGVEGLHEEYDFPNLDVRERTVDAGIQVGYWRSVGHSSNAFATEVLITEIAVDLGIDPVELRLRNLTNNPQMQRFISFAAEKANWNDTAAPGRHRGFALHRTYGTAVVQVAEVSFNGNFLQLDRVICVVDCGPVVNPDIVRSQMESGIIFGASAALFGEITFTEGRAVQSNFHDYPVLRMHNAPEIEVHLFESDAPPTGVGEPSTAPIAPAIANAVFAATGARVRQLPLRHQFQLA